MMRQLYCLVPNDHAQKGKKWSCNVIKKARKSSGVPMLQVNFLFSTAAQSSYDSAWLTAVGFAPPVMLLVILLG